MASSGGNSRTVEVVESKGCSRLFVGFSPLSSEPMSPASSSSSRMSRGAGVTASGPFFGLIICVTGLSKEARKQVMAATERLGGQYSPNLHPQCTHLVVQSFGGHKFEHALKHGSRNGLFVVTLGWFVNSVKRNVRLSESLYTVKTAGENGSKLEFNHLAGVTDTEKSCLPVGLHDHSKQFKTNLQPQPPFSGKVSGASREFPLSGFSIYVDSDISDELQKKVADVATVEGATIVEHWFVGCGATHVVCKRLSIQRYIGHSNNVVTPLWILKTAKEKYMQRLVHLSADLARHVGVILENLQNAVQDASEISGLRYAPRSRDRPTYRENRVSSEERQQIVNLAKVGVRNRRGRRMQTCQTPIHPITPSTLLASICWSVSDPTSSVCIYTEVSGNKDGSEHQTSEFFDTRGDGRDSEASFVNFSRPLKESEKAEKILKNNFLTVLFPIDRFGEMGPSSRTFFADNGFTCLHVLDIVYTFYQENMSAGEVDAGIHTDSRYADRLRTLYTSKESVENGYVQFKRIDFLGSRRSFEMLKRVSGDNNSNVYELLIRA